MPAGLMSSLCFQCRALVSYVGRSLYLIAAVDRDLVQPTLPQARAPCSKGELTVGGDFSVETYSNIGAGRCCSTFGTSPSGTIGIIRVECCASSVLVAATGSRVDGVGCLAADVVSVVVHARRKGVTSDLRAAYNLRHINAWCMSCGPRLNKS